MNRSYPLHETLGYQLSRTARIVERPFEHALRRYNLSRLAWCVLLAIDDENLHLPSEIAAFIGVNRTAISRVLRGMESASLVERHEDPKDRRQARLTSTQKGREALAACTIEASKNAAHFRAKLTPEDHRTLLALLSKLQDGDETTLTTL
ncbi:MAG: MarR family winged helix-turn-helix transcriptional regulator [Halocynthiibacter sp.]